MGRKFKVWLDSGANIHSCYKQEIDIEEYLGSLMMNGTHTVKKLRMKL